MTRARGPWWVGLAVLCCAVLPFTPVADFYVEQAFVLFFFVALAQSWNILGGYSGYLSSGQAPPSSGWAGYSCRAVFSLVCRRS